MAGKTDYKRQFNAQNYDRIEITVKKGKKEIIKTVAENQGKSVNGFINEAIDEKIQQNYSKPASSGTDEKKE